MEVWNDAELESYEMCVGKWAGGMNVSCLTIVVNFCGMLELPRLLS